MPTRVPRKRKTRIDMYIFRHTLNSLESNFRLNCNLFMSNVTLLH